MSPSSSCWSWFSSQTNRKWFEWGPDAMSSAETQTSQAPLNRIKHSDFRGKGLLWNAAGPTSQDQGEGKIKLSNRIWYVARRPLLGQGYFLSMRPANERRRYYVTSSLIDWSHTQNDPCWGYYPGTMGMPLILKRKCNFGEIYTWFMWLHRKFSCWQCSQWWKFWQNDISVYMKMKSTDVRSSN